MKKLIIISASIFLIMSCTVSEKEQVTKEVPEESDSFNLKAYSDSIIEERNTANGEFKDTAHSPLTDEDILTFEQLDFFSVDTAYRIKARFVRSQNTTAFGMMTTTERLPVYEKYGEAHFQLKGENLVLNIYQSHDLRETEEYKDHLFAPFADNTNGHTSYGGGRYLDLKIPKSNEIIIDFNRAYNPYCAYNDRYSCPLIPKENILNVNIEAGVMKYGKH